MNEYRIDVDWTYVGNWSYAPIGLSITKIGLNGWVVELKGNELSCTPLKYPYLRYKPNETLCSVVDKILKVTGETLPDQVKDKVSEMIAPKKTSVNIKV